MNRTLPHTLPILQFEKLMENQTIPLPLANIRIAFHELGHRVNTALRTQVGDAACLNQQREECLRLSAMVEQHANILPDRERQVIERSINDMVEHLAEASQRSADPPDEPPMPVTTVVHTGRPGRPRIHIEPNILAAALELCGLTHLAPIFGVSSRTIHHNALALGLVEPVPPVYVEYVDENGNAYRMYRSSTGAMSQLSDDQLDEVVRSLVQAFPMFGRQMINGYLLHLGQQVPRARVQASYNRVHGPPASSFGPRRLQRHMYSVPGPNSLAHHDGQHGLIHWKIVIHAFIDGFSQLVTGIRAHDNNRAETVLELFLDLITMHGIPSRICGDHGTENIKVAEWMERYRGLGRGSYIWGRSVHNIRIERLWCDVMNSFGHKWKMFFQGLEMHDGLDPDLEAHIWLLHYLFLPEINADALEWANAWNSHTMRIRGERQHSPRDMFFFGMIQNGLRGVEGLEEGDDEDIGPLDEYGIDWEDYEEDNIRAHHGHENVADDLGDNPFLTHRPDRLSNVSVDEPNSPLQPDQIVILEQELERLPFRHSQSMQDQRLLWIEAMRICVELF